MKKITYAAAIAEALDEEMLRDSSVFLLGEDIGKYGGAFKATRGLYEKYPERILDMPISEAGQMGAAVGAAMTGMRPIIELQISDWVTIASDQLVNQAANMCYLFLGKISTPLVLRLPVGGYLRYGIHHSHNWESWFSSIPGLKVVLPSNPHDAKGLLKSAIRDNNPVVFCEHKRLYPISGQIPDDEYTIPFGQAEVKKSGEDITIVSYSYVLNKAVDAAIELENSGISAEVIDIRTTSPLDEETIIKSVKKTGRLLIVQEAWGKCSISSEIAAIIANRCYKYLHSPVIRITAKDAPYPFSGVLEDYILPQTKEIIEQSRNLVYGKNA